jgi:hypothetical protein
MLKAIKRYIAQASVKSFRAQLQMHFIQFPPKLLRKNQKNVATSLASKYRYQVLLFMLDILKDWPSTQRSQLA